MEVLEGERAETLDAEEHAESDGQLHERHQEHGDHADARLPVHAVLLERDALHRDLVARAVRAVELLLELEEPRLVRRERGRVAQLFEGEGEKEQPRGERARDDRVEPRQARRHVDQLQHPTRQSCGRPPCEPQRGEVAVLQGRERSEAEAGFDRVGSGQ